MKDIKKECTKCKRNLSLDSFGKCARNEKRGNHHGRNNKCYECARVSNRSNIYNITEEEVLEWMKIDNCQICGKEVHGSEKMFDHCHTKGHIRGILCLSCNTGLGSFGDNTDTLISAIEYLKNTIR